MAVRGEPADAARLSDAVQHSFQNLGLGSLNGAERPQLCVQLPGAFGEECPEGTALCLIGNPTPSLIEDADTIRYAKAMGAIYVPTALIVSRNAPEYLFTADGGLSEAGLSVLAAAIRDAVLAQKGFILPLAYDPPFVPEMNEALARKPCSEILKLIDWPGKSPAACLGAAFAAEGLELFIEGNIRLPLADGADTRPFRLPFTWDIRLDERSATALYGLNSVSNVLLYWLLRANRLPVRHAGHIEVLLKHRGITASGLLTGAGAILLDFLRAQEGLPEQAWSLTAVRSRAVTFELFLCCCKIALARRIRFNESACAPVFAALLQLLERLRPAAGLGVGTANAVAEAARYVALVLPLRQVAYGAALQNEAMEYLRCNLLVGMSSDGVWEEGFVQHCRVMSSLRGLAADFRAAGLSNPELAETTLKLARFVDLFVTPEGLTPAIAEQPPVDMKRLAGASRELLRKASGTSLRPANEEYLPASGYFISRSGKADRKSSSHLVLMSRPASRGGPSLAFSVAGLPILIGGGSLDSKAPREVRRAAIKDPASHNSVRIDERSYDDADKDPSRIHLAGMWHEKDWAAARLVNEAFPPAIVDRTVIHLRAAHALLVIDRFAGSQEMRIEQFWHFAPELQPHAAPLFFSAGKRGIVSVAFEGGTFSAPEAGGKGAIGWTTKAKKTVVPNPYIRCSTTGASGILAAFFALGPSHARAELQVHPVGNGWRAALSRGPLEAAFELQEGQIIAIP